MKHPLTQRIVEGVTMFAVIVGLLLVAAFLLGLLASAALWAWGVALS